MSTTAYLKHREVLLSIYLERAQGTVSDEREEELADLGAKFWDGMTSEEKAAMDLLCAALNREPSQPRLIDLLALLNEANLLACDESCFRDRYIARQRDQLLLVALVNGWVEAVWDIGCEEIDSEQYLSTHWRVVPLDPARRKQILEYLAPEVPP